MSDTPNIQWDAKPDTSELAPAQTPQASAQSAQGRIQWDSTPDVSALKTSIPAAHAPNGMPANSMQAVADEQTPEGHAAAVAQREAQHPIVTGLGEAAGDVWDAVKSMANPLNSGLAGATTQAYEHIKEAVPLFQTYENARANGKTVMESLGAANAKAKQIHDAQDVVKQRVEEFKKNPTVAATRAVADAAALAASMWSGGEPLEAPAASAEAQAAGNITHVFDPTTETLTPVPKPGLVQQVLKGKNVAEPQAQTAIRALAEEGTPSTAKLPDVLDKSIDDLQTREQAAYKKMDDAAELDVKAEKQQLANDQYKLKQLGNTDADITQKGNLVEAINDSQARIADAEAKMKAAGVDPAEADALHMERMAKTQFRDKILHNQSVVDMSGKEPTVNIDNAIKESQKLIYNEKYGEARLNQAFDEQAAKAYMDKLRDYHEQGVHAVKLQTYLKTAGKLLHGAGWLVGGYEVLKHSLAD